MTENGGRGGLAVVVKQQQVFFAISVARLTIDRVLAAVLVSVWTLVSVLVRLRRWSPACIERRIYASLWRRLCRICCDPHCTRVVYQEFLMVLGLDHKAAPLGVDSPIDWYNPAKRTGWNYVATRFIKFRVRLTTVAACGRDWASPVSEKSPHEFDEPVFHGFFFLDQVETTRFDP